MSLIPPWLRPTRVRERLASYHLRPDVLDAAAAMASDQRSDIYVVRLESALTDSETVLRIRCLWHARSESGVLPRLGRLRRGALTFEQLQDALRVLPDRADVAEHQLGRSVLRHPL